MVLSGVFGTGLTDAAPADGVPSRYGVDAPELAALGPLAVGVRTLHLVSPDQIDPLVYDAAHGATRHDRRLTVDLWYPAEPEAGAPTAVYSAFFPSEPPAPPVEFSVPGIAVRDAPARLASGAAGTPDGTGASGGARSIGYPLIVVSHGYSNDPAAMTWLTENLASKGYVVAALRHDDPSITDATKIAGPLLRRPLDIVFAVDRLRKDLSGEHLVDASRVALIGYSMGGYGVLTAAGATLDPAGPLTHLVPGGLLQPYARGGALQAAMTVKGLRAVVALAPAGGGRFAAWGAVGLLGIETPLLLIAGDHDRTVDFVSGARAIFDGALGAHRYLLTFLGAGHAIGLSPAPDAMKSRLWDQDWFEDPVWRKERINAINAHFITAFLDLYVKQNASRAAYLDVPVKDAAAGVWPADAPPAPYDAFSPGTGAVSVWKGFQRSQSAGLELIQAAARPGG